MSAICYILLIICTELGFWFCVTREYNIVVCVVRKDVVETARPTKSPTEAPTKAPTVTKSSESTRAPVPDLTRAPATLSTCLKNRDCDDNNTCTKNRCKKGQCKHSIKCTFKFKKNKGKCKALTCDLTKGKCTRDITKALKECNSKEECKMGKCVW